MRENDDRMKGSTEGANELAASWRAKAEKCMRAVRDFLYGMTIHELELDLRRERADLENLFMLIVFGDLVGLPILPPYYSMRILPYLIPFAGAWKRNLLREKDLTDVAAMDL